jgi:hypothetical protein
MSEASYGTGPGHRIGLTAHLLRAARHISLGDEEQRQRTAVYGGWRLRETLEDVEQQERLVVRYAERNPGTVDQSDAAIAREMLKLVRRSIERHGRPLEWFAHPTRRISIHRANSCRGSALCRWGNRGASGPFGPRLSKIPYADVGELPFHALR